MEADGLIGGATPPGVVGLGIDVVDVPRLDRALARTPGLVDRLFTPAECRVLLAARDPDRVNTSRSGSRPRRPR